MEEPSASSRSSQLERKLAVPVLLAALASIPAVPLALWGEGPVGTVGTVVNRVAGLVLWVEWLLLIVLAEERLEWLRQHKWSTLVVLLTIPAVLFMVGPAQALRLVHVVATLRLVHLTRLVKVGRVLGRWLALSDTARITLLATSALAAGTLAMFVLADPESDSRRLLLTAVDRVGLPWPVLLCGALLLGTIAAAFGYVWFRRRGSPETRDGSETDGS
ncbi:metal-sensitive transcriptional repressor family protein [Halostreptopolyspora alba]|uniref:Metal-sensitive transcriptional repressor family protein n=1 Tax=Halostreptopolyspora alba TaxID=2487137 RepID=A0A3N0E2R8_9ACTN|nr:metal-sensitive transcriptional repressor family protein [Nocardiopsaceae bacterium YIM 96095]